MLFLLFDTSSNGKPADYKASVRDTANWPRMTHLAWNLMNDKGQIIKSANDLIKPKGYELNEGMAERHRLTKSAITKEGKDLKVCVEAFMQIVPEADMVFAHNLALNQGIVGAESDRSGVIDRLSSADAYCLMQETTYYCALPGRRGKYKWPSLPELHQRIFGKSYQNAGHAEADLNALGRCFIVLYKTKVLEDIFDD